MPFRNTGASCTVTVPAVTGMPGGGVWAAAGGASRLEPSCQIATIAATAVIANIPNSRLIILLSYRSKMKQGFIIYNLYESAASDIRGFFAAASASGDYASDAAVPQSVRNLCALTSSSLRG